MSSLIASLTVHQQLLILLVVRRHKLGDPGDQPRVAVTGKVGLVHERGQRMEQQIEPLVERHPHHSLPERRQSVCSSASVSYFANLGILVS